MKKNLLSITKLLCISIISICLFTGCSKNAKIVGTWNYLQESTVREDVFYVFNEDNTGNYNFNGLTRNFTYKIEDNSIILEYESSTTPSTFEFSIEDDILSIQDEFGSNMKYKRK